MRRIKATTSFQNKQHIDTEEGKTQSGQVHVVPDDYARKLVKKGYAEYAEDMGQSEEEFMEKKATSETKEGTETETETETENKNVNSTASFWDTMIGQKDFPSQIFGIIKSADIHTWGDLKEYQDDFTDIDGVGPAYASDIQEHYRKAKRKYVSQ